MLHPAALLTAEECRRADRAAIDGGVPGETLMENAGRAVVDLVLQQYKPQPTLVVCGGGNNGGDGFVAARLLKERGWEVTPAVIGNAGLIGGDAKKALDQWNRAGSAVHPFHPDLLQGCALVIDAIFGAGLNRPVEGQYKAAIDAINAGGQPVVAIDIASGINADTGAVMGAAIRAAHTVTFVRPKPGQVLLPGKAHMGKLHVYDIGIAGDTLTPRQFLNIPPLWRQVFPSPPPEAHKYTRGHTLVVGGDMGSTGAARLAAMGALRAGSGLVSVACPQNALPVYAITLTAVMTKPYQDAAALRSLLQEPRLTATLIGPGCGVSEQTREQALLLLGSQKPCVIDADALSVFEPNPTELFNAIHSRSGAPAGAVVLTPHEGEFKRLFSAGGIRSERTREAAQQSGAVVVLKGNDTVIAAPDGRIAVNANAPAWLATAGSGDVLSGIVAGLMAQGMPAFEAACTGVWLHGEAAAHFGPGLIAEDLPSCLPAALRQLYA